MSVQYQSTDLPGVILFERKLFHDDRGYFTEMYHSEKYKKAGLDMDFPQDNVSFSKQGVLRGLHYQLKYPQAKLLSVLEGEIFDVAVDIRKGSPTFGKWVGYTLSADNGLQLFVPEGFAHGFYVTSKTATVHYKCSRLYQPNDDRGLSWADPTININWPEGERILSEKDAALPEIGTVAAESLPAYSAGGENG